MSDRLLARRKFLLGASGLLIPVKPALAFPPFGVMFGKTVAGHVSGFSASYISSNSNATSWASQNIGPAGADRILVIVVAGGGATAPTGVTVDGNACTSQVTSGTGPGVRIWSIAWPTGTTATIAVTGSSSATLNFIHVYAIYGLSSITAAHTGVSDSITTCDCDVNLGGVVIGGGYRQSGVIAVNTSGGFGQNSQLNVSGNYSAAGSLLYSPNAGTKTMTLSAAANRMALAAWGPT